MQSSRLEVRVKPNSSRRALLGFREGVLQIAVHSPPEKGKANQEVRRFLSKLLGIPASRITIINGMTSRTKIFKVEGIDASELQQRLVDHLEH